MFSPHPQGLNLGPQYMATGSKDCKLRVFKLYDEQGNLILADCTEASFLHERGASKRRDAFGVVEAALHVRGEHQGRRPTLRRRSATPHTAEQSNQRLGPSQDLEVELQACVNGLTFDKSGKRVAAGCGNKSKKKEVTSTHMQSESECTPKLTCGMPGDGTLIILDAASGVVERTVRFGRTSLSSVAFDRP